MEPLIIIPSEETPQVQFDGDRGYFRITGKSYPEDLMKFYGPVVGYIQEYIKTPAEHTRLELNWLYYNTATSKLLVRLIVLFRDHCQSFKVKWICKKDYDLMIEKGEELKNLLNIDLEISED